MVVPMKPPRKGWKVLENTMKALSSPSFAAPAHDFLHARVGPAGLQRAGWIRIAFATLFLWDRFLLGLDLELFFHPKTGLVPLETEGDENLRLWTLFRQAGTGLPVQSMAWYWVVYLAGMVAGLLLWLGVAPRIQLSVMWLSLLCFEHHNQIITDASDSMFSVWAMMLMFLPLHHVTIWDRFGQQRRQESSSLNDVNECKSWPIWPFRLWQLYMSLIYIGASVGKLHNSSAWVEGYAMYNIVHNTEGYPGMWNPPLLFGRRGPLLLMTWTAIIIEVAAWWTIWIKPLRRITLCAVVAFHVGIDVSMNMTCLQWLTILGWCVFLVQPETEATKTTKKNEKKEDKQHVDRNRRQPNPTSVSRRLLDTLVFVTLFGICALDCFPSKNIYEAWVPEALDPHVEGWVKWHERFQENYLNPTLGRYGFTKHGEWSMYDEEPSKDNFAWKAVIRKNDESIHEWYSPDFVNMPFWQRKRQARLQSFYNNVGELNSHVWPTLAHRIASHYQKGVLSIELILLHDEPPNYWTLPNHENGRFWDVVAPQPMKRTWYRVLTLQFDCEDANQQECTTLVAQTTEACKQEDVQDYCPSSCNVCATTQVSLHWNELSGDGEHRIEDSSKWFAGDEESY